MLCLLVMTCLADVVHAETILYRPFLRHVFATHFKIVRVVAGGTEDLSFTTDADADGTHQLPVVGAQHSQRCHACTCRIEDHDLVISAVDNIGLPPLANPDIGWHGQQIKSGLLIRNADRHVLRQGAAR